MANKRQRKKRLKKLAEMKLENRIVPGEVPIESVSPTMEVVSAAAKKLTIGKLYPGKYAIENKEYQSRLDLKYKGSVQAVERFISMKAVILHRCTECKKKWYSRPDRLLLKTDQAHLCHVQKEKVV